MPIVECRASRAAIPANCCARWLFIVTFSLGITGCTFGSKVDEQFYQPTAAPSTTKPLKVALVEDPQFAAEKVELKRKVRRGTAAIEIQPALTNGIKEMLSHQFQTVVVVDASAEASDANLLVYPSVGTFEYDPTGDISGSLELTFKDATSGNVVASFQHKASAKDPTPTGQTIASAASAIGNAAPYALPLTLVGETYLAATGSSDAERNQKEISIILAQDLDGIATDVQSSPAFEDVASPGGKTGAAQIVAGVATVALTAPNPGMPPIEKTAQPPSTEVPVHEHRVALVIGNGAYQNAPSLTSPVNDARLMASTLQRLGFSLVGGGAQLDLDKPAFERSIQAFGNQMSGATVALFYYSGFGIQIQGANYLVPVSANPGKESDVDFQLIDSQVVLHQMQDGGAHLNILVLDACRNNPFTGRGLRDINGGLAQLQAPEGTLISYAAQPGRVASDENGTDSAYTEALTKAMEEPGLNVFHVFNEVGLIVKRNTAGNQQPWISSSPIQGNFYFSGEPAVQQAGKQ
jgi:hypothetical protein